MAVGSVFTNKGGERVGITLAALTFYLGIGSGSTTPVVADTALETALAETRVVTTNTNPTTLTLKLSGSITLTGTRAITEGGIFDGAGSGSPPTGANLWQHTVHAVDNLVSGDIYVLNTTVTLVPS